MIRLASLALALPVTTAAPIDPPATIGFGNDTIAAHKLSGIESVVADDGGEVPFGEARLDVTISPAGQVIDIEPQDGETAIPPSVVAAARGWTFRPFLWHGRPVIAKGSIAIGVVPKPIWADREAAFPAIDYARLRIELTRTACFGSCPDYKVVIDGAGNVEFSTRDDTGDAVAKLHRRYASGRGVLITGTHRATIDRATLDGLIAAFRRAHFFGLKSQYAYPATDNSTQILTFVSGGRTMTVSDYIGTKAGMPPEARALEDAIDAAAGTARWVTGDATTVAALRSERFDPASADAADLALAAIGSGGEAVTLGLIDAGMPLDRAYSGPGEDQGQPLGAVLLRNALALGRPAVAKALIDRGWARKMDRAALNEAFATGGGGCDVAVARALVAAGADVHTLKPGDSDWRADVGSALATAIAPYAPCDDDRTDRPALARALLALGVDPNARDPKGQTVIFGVEDATLLDILLAGGARADVKDKAGKSPVFSSWTDEIVLRLLEAGADPSGKDEGKTLRQIAVAKGMPGTLAWLDAHAIR